MDSEYLAKLTNTLVEEFDIEPDAIVESASLYDDLGLDSIDAVDLVVRLRELTGKKFPPEKFKSVVTIGDIVSVLQEL
jgi:acyl carrier protein